MIVAQHGLSAATTSATALRYSAKPVLGSGDKESESRAGTTDSRTSSRIKFHREIMRLPAEKRASRTRSESAVPDGTWQLCGQPTQHGFSTIELRNPKARSCAEPVLGYCQYSSLKAIENHNGQHSCATESVPSCLAKSIFQGALLPLRGMRAGPAGGKEGTYSPCYPALSRFATQRTRGKAARAGLTSGRASGARCFVRFTASISLSVPQGRWPAKAHENTRRSLFFRP